MRKASINFKDPYQKDGSYIHNMCGGIPIHVPATLTAEEIDKKVVDRYSHDNGREMAIVRFVESEGDKKETLYAVYDYTYGRGKEYRVTKWRYTYDRSTEFEAMDKYLTNTLDMRRA